MEPNKKDREKTAEDAKGDLETDRTPDKHTDAQNHQVSDNNRNSKNSAQGEPGSGKEDKPTGKHASQGHSTEANDKGTATNTNETTLRAATTDSSRMPKNSNDDGPTGGNVR